MGRVRTKTVKKASKVIIEKYYTRLTLDFHTNKRIVEEVSIIPTKSLRNKIAGTFKSSNIGWMISCSILLLRTWKINMAWEWFLLCNSWLNDPMKVLIIHLFRTQVLLHIWWNVFVIHKFVEFQLNYKKRNVKEEITTFLMFQLWNKTLSKLIQRLRKCWRCSSSTTLLDYNWLNHNSHSIVVKLINLTPLCILNFYIQHKYIKWIDFKKKIYNLLIRTLFFTATWN